MSATRAAIRLWVVGSLAWIAFWTWNYAANCLRLDDGSLWCPTVIGNLMSRTDRLHMAYALFGLPMASLAVGLLCLWAVRASRKQLGAE
jgi:hypothetical protein